MFIAKGCVSLIARPAIVCRSAWKKGNSMGLRKSLKKAVVYLLGVVDEYWAMREPSQYGEKDPECSISAESQGCVSKSVSQ